MATPAPTDPPRLLILDVNETLSDLHGLEPAFESVGLPGARVPAWFAGVLRDAFALTALGDRPTFADLATDSLEAELGVGSAEPVLSAFATLEPHPDVLPGLRAIAALGIRMVTLSNGSAGVARALLVDRLAAAGRPGLVEAYLSVEDAPAWKPVRAAYEHALAATGVAAGEAMMVAVHPWDLEGARRAGLRTAWLRRDRPGFPASFSPPDLVARDLGELADLLGGDAGRET